MLFLLLIPLSLVLAEERPTIEWDIFEGSDWANIIIHEEWIFYDMHSAKVQRYIEFYNVSPIDFNFAESSLIESEKDIWDYELYDLTIEYDSLNRVDKDEGILQIKKRYLEKTYTGEDGTRLQAMTPLIHIKNDTKSILEEFNIANSLRYIGPRLSIIKDNNFWFPFEQYEFTRNISKFSYPYIYSAKLVVPKLFSFLGFYDTKEARIEGVYIPEKKIYPVQVYKNGTIYKKLDPITMTLLGSKIRPIIGPYSEEDKQIILILPTYMVSKEEKLGEVSFLPKNLNVVGVKIKRPNILIYFFIFVIIILLTLTYFYIRSTFYKKESKNVEFLSGYLVIIALQQGLVGLIDSARPFSFTIYDITIILPFLIILIFLIIKYFPKIILFILKILKIIYNLIKRVLILIIKLIKNLIQQFKK